MALNLDKLKVKLDMFSYTVKKTDVGAFEPIKKAVCRDNSKGIKK